jgi:selenocysteine lyase/cysteine desulfurase
VHDDEHREQGGTPAIVGAIRAGLVVQLQQELGSLIQEGDAAIAGRLWSEFGSNVNIVVLGPGPSRHRLPVFSFMIRAPRSSLFLHHEFVVALLNDLFGIQARGGCMCAGPYVASASSHPRPCTRLTLLLQVFAGAHGHLGGARGAVPR